MGNDHRHIGKPNSYDLPADFTTRMVDKDGNECWDELDNIIAVGALKAYAYGALDPFDYTNYGAHIDLFAPGSDLWVPSHPEEKGAYAPMSARASSWSSGVDSNKSFNQREYISPIPHPHSTANAQTPSSYIAGPVDLSSIDPAAGQSVEYFFHYSCKDAYDNLSLSLSKDGNTYQKIHSFSNTHRLKGKTYTMKTSYLRDKSSLHYKESDIIRVLETVLPEYLTDTFHYKFDWKGSKKPGLQKDDCRIYVRDFLNVQGPLKQDLSHSQEMKQRYYVIMGGTSIAAPIVAGAIATLLEAKPDLTPSEIKEILISTAMPIPETRNNVYQWELKGLKKLTGNEKVLDLKSAVLKLRERHPRAFKGITIPKTDGECGYSENTCKAGVLHDTPDSSSDYQWECRGQQGGSTKSCKESKGYCSATSKSWTVGANACGAAIARDIYYGDSITITDNTGPTKGSATFACGSFRPRDTAGMSNMYKLGLRDAMWLPPSAMSCTDGTAVVTPPVINGVCNNSQRNSCTTGTSSAVPDTDSHYQWQCTGQNGGNTASCQKAKPVSLPSISPPSKPRNIALTPGPESVTISWNVPANNGGAAITKYQYQYKEFSDSTYGSSYYDIPGGGSITSYTKTGLTSGTKYQFHTRACNGPSRCGDYAVTVNGATPTSVINAINGVCNNSQRNSCTTGTSNDGAVSDTSSYYRWRCDGSSSGNNSGTCQKAKEPCASTTSQSWTSGSNTCRATLSSANSGGSATATDTTIPQTGSVSGHGTGQATFSCDDGAWTQTAGATCSAACPSAATINGCMLNVPNTQHYTSAVDYRTRSCTAGYTGTSLYSAADQCRYRCEDGAWTSLNACTASASVSGQCGTTNNTCSAGTLNNTPDTDSHYQWQCTGQNGGNTASCQKAKPVSLPSISPPSKPRNIALTPGPESVIISWTAPANNGGAAITKYQYQYKEFSDPTYGSYHDIPGGGSITSYTKTGLTSGTKYQFHTRACNGPSRCGDYAVTVNGATPTSVINAINGVCNNSQRNSCTTGTSNDGAVSDTSSYYRWRCDGSSSGNNSGTCQKAKASCGSTSKSILDFKD